MSCVSLSSSPSTSGHSYGNSYASQTSAAFSTAPTSIATSPSPDSQSFDPAVRLRNINVANPANISTVPSTVLLPTELRPGPKEAHLSVRVDAIEAIGECSPEILAQAKQPRKKENFDFWGDLPMEIRVQILQKLKPKELVQCSAISKSWNKMCFDGQLWINVDTEDYYRDIPAKSLVKIITGAGPFVRDINLRGCIQMRETWVTHGNQISDACKNLECFSLEGCQIDRSSVHYLLLSNPRLVHINVSGLSALNNSAMKIIAQNCPLLEDLNVSWCPHIDTKGLQRIVGSCHKLKDLRAGEIRGFNDKDFLLDLFNHNSLERLVMNHCVDLSDDSLQILIQGINPEVDPVSDRAIVPPRRFRHLDFSRCVGLTYKGLKALAGNVPDLRGLQLSHCNGLTDDALTDVLESTPLLTHLDLEELEELSNLTLQKLAKARCAPRLQHLNISYCESLGDSGMLQVVKACPSLRSLVMDNTRVSDLVLIEAAAQVRDRDRRETLPEPTGPPSVGLNVVVFDCQNVTWTGIREILSRNSETQRREVISLKCFYGYQDTVNEHMKRVLRGDAVAASRLEKKWGEYMVASEEAGAGGAGARRRRRRLRDAAMVHADEEDGGPRNGRRRARSGGCTIM